MTAFSTQDADAWYRRNKHKLGVSEDPVITTLTDFGIIPHGRVFEFGCANGWRLKCLWELFDNSIECWGSEISQDACRDADKRIKLNMEPAIASCDMVIMGFVLYLVQPENLLYWAHYANSILKDGGHLVIYDFLPDHPYSRIFEHNPELRSRKMDHAALWLANPAYSIAARRTMGDEDDKTHVTILKKDVERAFPLKEIK